MEKFCQIIATLPSQRYDLPMEAMGQSFLYQITAFMNRVFYRKWDAEHLIFFLDLILQQKKGVT